MANKIDGNSNEFKTYGILATLSIVSILALVISVEKWKQSQEEVVCHPVKKTVPYPMISYMPDGEGVDSAKLYNFIEKYVFLTKSESLDQYTKMSTSEKFKNDYLKEKLQEAVYMSDGRERESNLEKVASSNDLYLKLKDCNCSWHFNIDAIERIERTPKAGVVYVSVLGEYQITYNKDVKKTVDRKIFGYKRIHLYIQQDVPETGQKDQYLNKYGMYVLDSKETDVSQSVQDSLFAANMIFGWGDINRKYIDSAFESADKSELEWGIE